MSKRKAFRVHQSHSPIIATTFVLLGGIVACLAIAAPFSNDMRYPLLAVGGMLLFVAVLIGFLSAPINHFLSILFSFTQNKREKKVTYVLKKIEPVKQTEPIKPPTAQTVRDIRGQ